MPEKGVVQRLIRISDSTVPAFSPIVCRYRAARYASVEGYGETQRQWSDSQLSDFGVQILDLFIVNLRLFASATFEHTRRPFEQRPLPLVDHRGVMGWTPPDGIGVP